MIHVGFEGVVFADPPGTAAMPQQSGYHRATEAPMTPFMEAG